MILWSLPKGPRSRNLHVISSVLISSPLFSISSYGSRSRSFWNKKACITRLIIWPIHWVRHSDASHSISSIPERWSWIAQVRVLFVVELSPTIAPSFRIMPYSWRTEIRISHWACPLWPSTGRSTRRAFTCLSFSQSIKSDMIPSKSFWFRVVQISIERWIWVSTNWSFFRMILLWS